MRYTEGVYTYYCNSCETVFGVVSRFAVKSDKQRSLQCPKCPSEAVLYGEGYLNHTKYEDETTFEPVVEPESREKVDSEDLQSGYPPILTSLHVAELLGVSRHMAYTIMERKDFPLIRLSRFKRVRRDDFFEWLISYRKEK